MRSNVDARGVGGCVISTASPEARSSERGGDWGFHEQEGERGIKAAEDVYPGTKATCCLSSRARVAVNDRPQMMRTDHRLFLTACPIWNYAYRRVDRAKIPCASYC